MKRIFHPYHFWEDWKAGLYKPTLEDPRELMVSRAARLLASPEELYRAMSKVAFDWSYSADVNLSNPSRNRRAWLGQAACCMVCGAPEDLTKEAWHRLSAAEQVAANAVADRVIQSWEASCQNVV